MKKTIYQMKLELEENGWEWNALDMMGNAEIRDKYEEMIQETI